MMKNSDGRTRRDAGFSLIELMIAMALTVTVLGIAAKLLASSVNVRAREDRRSEAVADARRALTAMTREIGNAGYALPAAIAGNGIVAANSNSTQIRVVSNLDKYTGTGTPGYTTSQDEDVIYRYVNDVANGESYILRYDVNSAIAGTTVLANRIDSMVIRYFDRRVTYRPGACQEGIDMATVTNSNGLLQAEVNPAQATYVVVAVCVSLPQVGTPGSPGFQPASRTQLISDVDLRNANTLNY